MKIKNYAKRVWDDCISMEIKSQPFIYMIVSGTILSLMFSPIVGIPLGMMIGSSKYQKNNIQQKDFK